MQGETHCFFVHYLIFGRPGKTSQDQLTEKPLQSYLKCIKRYSLQGSTVSSLCSTRLLCVDIIGIVEDLVTLSI